LTLAVLERAKVYYESEPKSRLAMASRREPFEVHAEYGWF